ncbi:MAG: hypothetical protein JO317_07665, partial [Verrucomicrobiae bacterium]|nr:hypothetical protein [Verrucomicrobiae bacterium]
MTALLLAALLAAPAPPPSSPLLHSRSRTGHAAPAVPALRILSVNGAAATESIAVDQPAAGVTVRAARPEPAGPIEEYARLRPEIRKLISLSYDLGRRNLRYLYGSADPQLGGLDCS